MSQTTNNNNTMPAQMTFEQMRDYLISKDKIIGIVYDKDFNEIFLKKILACKTMKNLIDAYHERYWHIGFEDHEEELAQMATMKFKKLIHTQYKKQCK